MGGGVGRINSSDKQCRLLSVWSAYLNLNTLSCQNYFFPEGMGGVNKTCGNSGGMGRLFLCSKMEIPGRRGGLCEIPSVVGVWIFSGTTQSW